MDLYYESGDMESRQAIAKKCFIYAYNTCCVQNQYQKHPLIGKKMKKCRMAQRDLVHRASMQELLRVREHGRSMSA